MKARHALATALFLWAGGVFAAQPADDLTNRVSRLERVVEGQALVDMLNRLDDLQAQVQQLRGRVDEQKHTIDELQRRNRELYTELDKRVRQIEQDDSGDTPDPSPFGANDAGSPDEQTAYQQGFELLRGLHYDQATTAFRQFLDRYPKGRYAPMAQYWLGEANYVQRDFKAAIHEYQKLIDNYPSSAKVPEAMFKIGDSYRELGDMDSAKKAFADLADKFPDSAEAAQSRSQLQQGNASH